MINNEILSKKKTSSNQLFRNFHSCDYFLITRDEFIMYLHPHFCNHFHAKNIGKQQLYNWFVLRIPKLKRNEEYNKLKLASQEDEEI